MKTLGIIALVSLPLLTAGGIWLIRVIRHERKLEKDMNERKK